MKTFYISFILFLVVTMNSCLTYRVAEYTITFADTFNSGKIQVYYTDIRSSEKDEVKREKDFNELIELLEEDKFLLDQIEDDVYVKERKIFEKNGQINGQYTGIFSDLKIEHNALKHENEEWILFLSLDEGQQIESNGKVLISNRNVLLTWPKDQKVLTFKVTLKNYDAETYPLIDYFLKWKQ